MYLPIPKQNIPLSRKGSNPDDIILVVDDEEYDRLILS